MSAQASNVGDYYEACDYDPVHGEHAAFNLTPHPEVTKIIGVRGFMGATDANKVIVGKASLAVGIQPGADPVRWTSMVRFYAMVGQAGANSVYNQYIHNNAFWYPEHQDHDTADYYHAMTPAVSNSQGSSGSERPELSRWFFTLSEFSASTKAKLISTGLLMPTMQMIMRRTRVASDAEYLSGKAHPSAFADVNNVEAMKDMARAMTPQTIPPMVKLAMVEDDYNGELGRDFFEYFFAPERFFDTPASIARIFRGPQKTKKIRVSAAASTDANGRVLTYHWAVLRGNPANVRITATAANNSEVEIEIDYHPKAVAAHVNIPSNLVVVGAFVHNGIYYSAPAFVTSYTLDHEAREYGPHGISKITFNNNYVLQKLSRKKSWQTDEYVYTPSGVLKGWVRTKNGAKTEFTKEGYRVTQGNLTDGVTKARRVSYQIESLTGALIWQDSGGDLAYTWDVTPPTVSITAPAADAQVSGGVRIDVAAFDANRIARVEFFVRDRAMGSDTTEPYAKMFDSSTFANGPAQIKVRAFDDYGNVKEAAVQVAFNNAAAPSDDPPTDEPGPGDDQQPNPDDPTPDIQPVPSTKPARNAFIPGRGENAVIPLQFASSGHAAVRIYDRLGQEVRSLGLDAPAGEHALEWDGKDSRGTTVPSGVYVALITGDAGSRKYKIVVLR